MRLGYHVSLSEYKNLNEVIKEVKDFNANVIQIFLSNPRSGKLKNRDDEYFISMGKILKENNIDCYIHGSYTINLAKNWDEYSWWITTIEKEFYYAKLLGAKGVVFHLGKQLDLNENIALNNMYTSIAYIMNKVKDYGVKLLIETSSGQGSEMCVTLEQFGKLYRKIKLLTCCDRIGICVDSCHIFAAGYNIKTQIGLKMYLDTFEEIIGLNNIKLIHLNDSKKECGTNLDRHENIGEGYIGKVALKRFFNFFQKKNIPVILETPSGYYKEEIKFLKN